jgi:sugar diacid utilization regulator
MHRLCRQADGGSKVVRWLNRRTGNWFGLVDRAGAVLVGEPSSLEPADVSVIKDGLAAMTERDLRVFSTSAGSTRNIQLLDVATPESRRAPVLTIVGAHPVSRSLAADAAMLIGTWWWVEETRRARRRLEATEARNREAVLHLLMSRHTSTARQIASVLSSPLPDPVHVHVIECDVRMRDSVIRSHRRWAPNAFVVACPVHRRHAVVIAPACSGSTMAGTVALGDDALAGCTIGTSDVVALPDAAIGYEQAFNALAMARGLPDRRAKFHPGLDPAVLFDPAAAIWAANLIAPLLDYAATRKSDPDAEELVATLQSWLSFGTAAKRHLKIHRNTLRTRLQRIETLLGVDLDRVDHQAALALALRIRRRPLAPQAPTDSDASGDPGPMTAPTFADLVRTPAMRHWAHLVLRPVRESANAGVLESSLRAWLNNDARLSAAAAVLGISVPGARKRIQRLEQLLERSLLHAPDGRHELYLAVRAMDSSAGATTPRSRPGPPLHRPSSRVGTSRP